MRTRSGSRRSFPGRLMTPPSRALEDGHRDDQPGLVRERYEALARAQLASDLVSARGPDHTRPSARVLNDADVAHPDSMREAGPERLRDRFLAREAHREVALGAAPG